MSSKRSQRPPQEWTRPSLFSGDRKDEAYLHLEDGTVLAGKGFGARGSGSGEVVFTTAMNGYPESLSDPSYKGQLLVMTHPLVGNYGVPKKVFENGMLKNFESERITVGGLIVSELTHGSKWNSALSLDEWLASENVPGIYGVDTRMLTKRIRQHGVMRGAITDSPRAIDRRAYERYGAINFVERISVKKPMEYASEGAERNIVVVDLGVKHGILRELFLLGHNVIRVPYDYPPDKILGFEPAGIVYSNGPGNPALLRGTIKNFSQIAEYKIPILGICLGHQVAALAFGARVRKMTFGHRAINKAVVDAGTGAAYITTHNHGYALYKDSLPEHSRLWFASPDDGVVEGLAYPKHGIITVQFHPEARPGTNDTRFVFKKFNKMIEDAR